MSDHGRNPEEERADIDPARPSSPAAASTAEVPPHPLQGGPSEPAPSHSRDFAVGARRFQFHSGPLPAPDVLAGYEALLPGGADRVFTMAEADLAHQHAKESAALQGHITLSSRGQWMAFLVAVLALLGGMVLVYLDKSVAGLTAMILPIATIIGIFVTSKMPRSAQPSDHIHGDAVPKPEPILSD